MKKQLLLPNNQVDEARLMLKKIADYLDKANAESLSCSLFNGNMGVALLFFYYLKFL